MSSSSSHTTHSLFQSDSSIGVSTRSQLVLVLISVAARLLLVTATTTHAAAPCAMQRALFAVPRSSPSFISIRRLVISREVRVGCCPSPSSYSTSIYYKSPKVHACKGNDFNEMTTQPNNSYHSEANQQSLTEQLAIRLVQGNDSADSSSMFQKPMKACIAVAGGGSAAASTIASTPGASSILLESIVTYDRRSFADYVTHNIAQMDDERWLMDLEQISTSVDGESSSDDSDQRIGSFQFCSIQAAVLLSRSSLNRSIQLTPSFQDRCLHCIGVGCTSALVGRISSEAEGGENGQSDLRSKAYIACSTVNDGTWVWGIELDNDISSKGDIVENSRRSRSQEEVVISNAILLAMIRYRELKSLRQLDDNIDDKYNKLLNQVMDRKGDKLSDTRIDGHRNGVIQEVGWSAACGATQIINEKSNAVVLLPIMSDDPVTPSNDEDHDLPLPRIRMETLALENNKLFPRDVLIVPGSFNPPHQGHIGLANAAVAALRRLRRVDVDEISGSDTIASLPSARSYSRHSSLSSSSSYSSSSILRNLWGKVDKHFEDPTVFFELSVTNADKPPLDPMEVERRVDIFTKLPLRDMPKDWAVMLTNAPLFSQKSEILAKLIPNDGHENDTNRRTIGFVLGTDTMVRIINPKYYDNSHDKMMAALVEMKEKGVHFIVGGRLEPGTNNFINGQDEVESLPPDVQGMFTLLTEDEFRMDISSTELRRRSDQNKR
jgi:hypothetical protein